MAKGYVRGEASAVQVQYLEDGALAIVARLYGAGESRAFLRNGMPGNDWQPVAEIAAQGQAGISRRFSLGVPIVPGK